MSRHDLVSAATARIGTASAGIAIRVAGIRAVVFLRVDRTACTGRLHHAGASELTRPPGGSHTGPAMVYGSKLCAVIVRCHFVLPLHGSGFHVPVVLRSKFTGGRASAESARTAIVADAIHREIVHHRTVVNVGEVRPAEIVHRPVIKESLHPSIPHRQSPRRV